MRIAFACPNFPPEFLGGTERVTAALARALRRAGDDVLVITGSETAHDGRDVIDERETGLAVLRIRRRPDEGYGLDVGRPRVRDLVAGLLREHRSEVLHVHHWATLSSGMLRAAERLGIATVATLHDMWTTCPRFFRRPPAGVECPHGGEREACVGCARLSLDWLSEAVLRARLAGRDTELRLELAAASAITAPSAACRDRIRTHLPFDGAIEVVPHGLLEPPGDHARVPGPPGVLRVGTFGNLVEEKGVMLLVWACRDIPALELHLFGPFLDPGFGESVVAKAREFDVALRCHGPYGNDGAHPARQLDLAVFPSLCEETYGLVVEEALARGTPVVVSDRGALAERIGGGGLVVPVDELGPLAGTLRRLAARPDELEALRAGLPRRFPTIDDAARRYRAIYTATVEARP